MSSLKTLVAWFVRIDSHDLRESGDSRESEIRVIQGDSAWHAMKKGVSIANDSRESIRANRVANRPCHLEATAAALHQGGTSAERSRHERFLSEHEFSHEKCSEILPRNFWAFILPWILDGGNSALVIGFSRDQFWGLKTLYLKAFQSLKNCLD